VAGVVFVVGGVVVGGGGVGFGGGVPLAMCQFPRWGSTSAHHFGIGNDCPASGRSICLFNVFHAR